MLKSATVCLPTLIKEKLDADHIQEWSEGMPEWKEKKEGDRERSEGWNNEEIVQWAKNIKTKKARRISRAASDSKLVNKVSIPAREVRTLWDMIGNVLVQSKQVGKMTDKIISHINMKCLKKKQICDLGSIMWKQKKKNFIKSLLKSS